MGRGASKSHLAVLFTDADLAIPNAENVVLVAVQEWVDKETESVGEKGSFVLLCRRGENEKLRKFDSGMVLFAKKWELKDLSF
ncbi:hypothetical protein HDV00_002037, partial [Rhizophlyctis rosea]